MSSQGEVRLDFHMTTQINGDTSTYQLRENQSHTQMNPEEIYPKPFNRRKFE